MRRPDTWSYTNVTPMSILDRGYTGHEHLPQFGLINMNGRMYDPLVGRMLSPDPYVHGIAGTQGFNRYSYALNNPLKFTDPSGEHPILAAAMLGAVIAGFSVGITDMATGRMTTGGQFLGHLAVGAAAGAAGAAIGAGAVGVLEGAVYGAASGAASGFIGGAGSAWVRGASASEIFRQGLRGAAWGAATGAVAGGVGGGIKAKRMGLDPMTGKGIGKPTYSAMPETATTTSGVRERSKYTIFGETNMDLDITEDTYLQFPGSKEYVQNATIGEGMLKGKVELKGYRLVNSSGETIGGACAPYKSSAFGNVKGAISISPMMAMYADDLLAVLGHEVIHAYQFSQGFTQLFNEGIMEYYAHRFSASIPHSLQTGSKMMMQYYQPYFSPVRSLHDFYPPWAIPFVR